MAPHAGYLLDARMLWWQMASADDHAAGPKVSACSVAIGASGCRVHRPIARLSHLRAISPAPPVCPWSSTSRTSKARRLTLLDSLPCPRLALWDEEQRALVSFRDHGAPPHVVGRARRAVGQLSFLDSLGLALAVLYWLSALDGLLGRLGGFHRSTSLPGASS
jgi:hypothetical protein